MLTDTQKTQVRFYLGQSSVNRYLNARLEGVWGALDTDAENIIVNILGQLTAVDTQIFGTGGALGQAGQSAGIKSVEEIAFAGNGNAVDIGLRRLGRALVGRLSALLGVPVYADVFGEAGWPGDNYSRNGLASGGGNTFGLG